MVIMLGDKSLFFAHGLVSVLMMSVMSPGMISVL